jgi:hypothetical protein
MNCWSHIIENYVLNPTSICKLTIFVVSLSFIYNYMYYIQLLLQLCTEVSQVTTQWTLKIEKWQVTHSWLFFARSAKNFDSRDFKMYVVRLKKFSLQKLEICFINHKLEFPNRIRKITIFCRHVRDKSAYLSCTSGRIRDETWWENLVIPDEVVVIFPRPSRSSPVK